ncbi:transcriptional repressor [Actinomadura sp. NBRC 104412]|uniref:transcriptional repressor n=1 Tax=Actinomadura sp. NBRC 104412 TaxID=3032203 RepID=UPI0033288A55
MAGHRSTTPRRQVLEVLAASEEHLTAEAIHTRIADRGRTVAPSTVYGRWPCCGRSVSCTPCRPTVISPTDWPITPWCTRSEG